AYEYHQWRIRNSVVLNLSQTGIGVTNRIYHYGYNNDFIQFGHHNMTFHIGSATDRRVLIQSNQVQFSNLANGVDINADLDVDGHTNLDHVSIAGVTTAFRIRLEDNRYLQIGNDSDLQLYHDGTNSYINEGGTGSLFIAGSALRLQSNDNRLNDANGNVIIKTDATSAYLYYEGSNRLNTTSVGINIPQDLDVDGHTNLDNVSIVGVATVTGSNINIEGGSTALTQLKINSTGRHRGIQLD
ncbi:MAG: hypothetical protein VXY93_12195, partial [Pseudomonadota bacterium]|nr:hypothetical protein [Pseudomonadota bacterium]